MTSLVRGTDILEVEEILAPRPVGPWRDGFPRFHDRRDPGCGEIAHRHQGAGEDAVQEVGLLRFQLGQ